jgi:hypothetical protein
MSYFTSKRICCAHSHIKFTENQFIDYVAVIAETHVLLKCESYYSHHILKYMGWESEVEMIHDMTYIYVFVSPTIEYIKQAFNKF